MKKKDSPSRAPGCRPIELFVPEIRFFIERQSIKELQELLAEVNPIDLADGFDFFPPEQQLLIFKLLTPVRMMEVFEELHLNEQEYILQHLEDQPIDGSAQFFKKLPTAMVKKMTTLMNRERVDDVQETSDYPPHTVGAIMHSNFIHVGPDMTAKATLALLQARSRVRVEEDIHMIYVTNGNRRLLGGVALRTLIAAPANIKMSEIMAPMSPIRLSANMDREEASKIFTRYKMLSAPVVNESGSLVGVLAADDVIQVIEAESTEDIQKLAGVEALEVPYFQTGFFEMIKKRAFWLCVLFVGESITAIAMGFFEKEIEKAVVLALFIPLIISSGGNSGSQAATLIVRALALKEIGFSDWWKVMKRELGSGLVLGLILGAMGFAMIMIKSLFSTIYGPHVELIALAVSLSLIFVVLWGSLSGSLLPIFLKKAGLDPAVASTPFVATLVDVTGLIIYFSISVSVLKGTLL